MNLNLIFSYLLEMMKIKMIETDFVGVGIDVPEDLEKARKLLNP